MAPTIYSSTGNIPGIISWKYRCWV